jgi:hypothetical protein
MPMTGLDGLWSSRPPSGRPARTPVPRGLGPPRRDGRGYAAVNELDDFQREVGLGCTSPCVPERDELAVFTRESLATPLISPAAAPTWCSTGAQPLCLLTAGPSFPPG